MSLWAPQTTGKTLVNVYPLESRLLHRTGISELFPPLFPNTRTKNPSPKMLCFWMPQINMIIW